MLADLFILGSLVCVTAGRLGGASLLLNRRLTLLRFSAHNGQQR